METIIFKNGIEIEVKARLVIDVIGYCVKNKTLGQMEEILTDENLKEIKVKNSSGIAINTFTNLTIASMEKNYVTNEVYFSLKEVESTVQ